MLKRSLDILLSLCGLLAVLPFFPLIGLLIKLDSKGPVFYLCDRISKDGKPFKMYKFRTMRDTPSLSGPSVTPAGDPRVTSVGRFLRRTKLNELPQLINVFQGEMTFVGPRPEAPDLAALYPPEAAKAIFAVKPGLVGPNQILGRNEEEFYPPGVDPQQYYIEVILPKKLPLDLEYVGHVSMFSDLKYIFLGVKETLFKALSWNLVLQNKSQLYLLCADLTLSLVSFVLAYVLKFGGFHQSTDTAVLVQLLLAVLLVRILCFVSCGLYSTLIRYLSFHDVASVVKGVSGGSILLMSLTFLSDFREFSRMVFLLDWLCLVILLCALRSVLRFYWDRHIPVRENTGRKVLIFGAGDAGALAYRSLMAERETAFDVVGFLDDDPAKRHKTMYGKKVLGNRHTLEAVVRLYHVQEIVLALPSVPSHEIAKIIQACQHANIRYWAFPTLKDTPRLTDTPWPESSLAELLNMQDIQMDVAAVRQIVQGKTVLVTGACGEFTVELCRQLLLCSPQKLIIIDRYESYLTELLLRLLNTFPAELVVPVLCPSAPHDTVKEVFREYQPDVVFHTTTRKYLPMFDIQVEEVVRVNYLSTFELARQAANYGCTYFVMISSEAATMRGNPISESLRATEISLRQFFASHQTRLVVARLSNVLENRGGLVTSLQDQIAHREAVTLPQSEAGHHFLSKHAAAHFVLQSLALAHANPTDEGIFVCIYDTTMSLREVANKLALLSGMQLETDIPIKALNSGAVAQRAEMTSPSHEANVHSIPTTHTHINLVRQAPLANAPEFLEAIRLLFSLKEHDIKGAAWEKPTHTLLALSSSS